MLLNYRVYFFSSSFLNVGLVFFFKKRLHIKIYVFLFSPEVICLFIEVSEDHTIII